MPHSFFHLVPPHADTLQAHQDSLSPADKAELEAFLRKAMALSDTLSDAIDAYTESHPDISYGVILEALLYLQWYMQRRLNEERADA